MRRHDNRAPRVIRSKSADSGTSIDSGVGPRRRKRPGWNSRFGRLVEGVRHVRQEINEQDSGQILLIISRTLLAPVKPNMDSLPPMHTMSSKSYGIGASVSHRTSSPEREARRSILSRICRTSAKS